MRGRYEPEGNEMNSELCYAHLKTFKKKFYLPVKECKHFVLFPIVK